MPETKDTDQAIEETFRPATKKEKANEDKIKQLIREARDFDFQQTHPEIVASAKIAEMSSNTELDSQVTIPNTVFEEPETEPLDATVNTLNTLSYNIPLKSISFDSLYSDIFEPCTKMYGRIYEPVKKLMLYIGIANALKHNMIEDLFFHDMRINALICLPPGGGKHMLKRSLMMAEVPGSMSFIVPTSYHPEHFVGKLSWDPKEKKTTNHKGYLEDDCVIIDEAKPLLKDPEFMQARKYIRTSLDPIGVNEVVKQTIDTPEKLRKRFYPEATIVMFFQPDTYPDELATEGDLRRCVVSYFAIPHTIKRQTIREKVLAGKPDRVKHMTRRNQYSEFLQGLRAHPFKWDLSLIREEIERYAEQFYEYAASRGAMSNQIADDAYFDAVLQLTRFTCVRAACDGTEQPTLMHLRAAYSDYWIFYQQFVDFCVQLLPGKFINVNNKKISAQDYEKVHVAVSWCAEQGALSPVLSNLNPRHLTEWMEKQGWGGAVGNGGSYRLYKLMKEYGFIEFQRKHNAAVIWVRTDRIPEQWKEELRGSLAT